MNLCLPLLYLIGLYGLKCYYKYYFKHPHLIRFYLHIMPIHVFQFLDSLICSTPPSHSCFQIDHIIHLIKI
jgi:hypothetical protein